MTSTKQTAKNIARHILASAYHLSGAYKPLHKGKVLILMYHRVLSQKELNHQYVQPGMYVHRDVFEKQMHFLHKNFQIISFPDLLLGWKEKSLREDQKYCVITFDDGWLDNYLYAYPILIKYHIPATIFLATAFIGTDLWPWSEKISHLLQHYYARNQAIEEKRHFDLVKNDYPWLEGIAGNNGYQKIDSAIEQCKSLSDEEIQKIIDLLQVILGCELPKERLFLNWEEIREMSEKGLSFGSHSCTHKILTKYSSETIQKELVDSYRDLSLRKINFVPIFCYPNGGYNSEIVGQVRDAGYQAATNTVFGYENLSPDNSFLLKRIGIHQDISSTIPLFSFHLSGLLRKKDRVYPKNAIRNKNEIQEIAC